MSIVEVLLLTKGNKTTGINVFRIPLGMDTQSNSKKDHEDPIEWVDLYGDYLLRFALMRVEGVSVAEDLVQEAFLAAIKSWKRFEGKSSVKTWLTGILKYKILDHYRKRGRETNFTELSSFYEKEEEQHFAIEKHWALDGEFSPNQWKPEQWSHVDQSEFMRQFLDCSEKLPKKVKQVFIMREVDGLESREIMERLEISQQNLWTILHRARMALRKCLESKGVSLFDSRN